METNAPTITDGSASRLNSQSPHSKWESTPPWTCSGIAVAHCRHTPQRLEGFDVRFSIGEEVRLPVRNRYGLGGDGSVDRGYRIRNTVRTRSPRTPAGLSQFGFQLLHPQLEFGVLIPQTVHFRGSREPFSPALSTLPALRHSTIHIPALQLPHQGISRGLQHPLLILPRQGI